jgi:hypothetical protein
VVVLMLVPVLALVSAPRVWLGRLHFHVPLNAHSLIFC